MNTKNGGKNRHPIRVVAKRTGLTPTLLRAWERRYQVVSPERTNGGQRLYSDEDVRRLALLSRVVEEGRNISQVATLSMIELEGLVREDQAERITPPAPEPLEWASVPAVLSSAREAVSEMDAAGLERGLIRGAMALPVPVFTDEVLIPLLAGIGDDWSQGGLGPAQEHLASRAVRRVLEWLLDTVSVETGSPVLVSATPAGEEHEFGALLAAVAAATEGWQGIFLGPNLPAVEITGAALRLKAAAVVLSVVGKEGAANGATEVGDLRDRLPPTVPIFLGGEGSVIEGLAGDVEGVETISEFEGLRKRLRGLWVGQ